MWWLSVSTIGLTISGCPISRAALLDRVCGHRGADIRPDWDPKSERGSRDRNAPYILCNIILAELFRAPLGSLAGPARAPAGCLRVGLLFLAESREKYDGQSVEFFGGVG
jgi:hypothetical protein